MIVVTGMHRSGTSMISRLLWECGMSFGDPSTFLAGDRWNQRGYFEQKEVMDLNSLLITGVPRNTNRLMKLVSQLAYVRCATPFLPSAGSMHALKRRAHHLRGRLEELGGRYLHQGLKDPRFCLTLGIWKEVVPIEKTVVCLRSPSQTARSLERRNRLPLSWAYRFWNHHVRHLLQDLEGLDPLVVDFDALCAGDGDRELVQMRNYFGFPLSSAELHEKYAVTFDRRLYHGGRSEEHEMLPADTRELWERLKRHHHDSLERFGSRL